MTIVTGSLIGSCRPDVGGGQVDGDRRADPTLRLKIDPAVGLRNHAVDDGETQPSAVAGGLRRDERLERASADVLVHAEADVADRQADVAARTRVGVAGRRALAEDRVRCSDDHPAAAGHGLPRVDGQVDEHPLELGGIGFDGPELSTEARLEHDLLAERAAQQAAEAADDLVRSSSSDVAVSRQPVVSSRCVSSAALRVASRITSRSSRAVPFSGSESATNVAWLRMIPSRLFKSWAIPRSSISARPSLATRARTGAAGEAGRGTHWGSAEVIVCDDDGAVARPPVFLHIGGSAAILNAWRAAVGADLRLGAATGARRCWRERHACRSR